MGIDERFSASSNVWRRYGILFKVLTEKYSFETALDHHLEARLEVSEKAMKILEEKHDTLDDQAYAQTLRENFQRAGYDADVDLTDSSIQVTVKRCPFYNGLVQAGIEHDDVLRICESSYAQRERNYPLFLGLVRQRDSTGGYCVERFRL